MLLPVRRAPLMIEAGFGSSAPRPYAPSNTYRTLSLDLSHPSRIFGPASIRNGEISLPVPKRTRLLVVEGSGNDEYRDLLFDLLPDAQAQVLQDHSGC